MNDLGSLANVNVELTTRCNKACWMCGRRKREEADPESFQDYQQNMDIDLVRTIAEQLPKGIVVQLHWNGEALMHSQFGKAVRLFPRQIVSLTSNGKLLVAKAGEVIDYLDTLSISIIENDPEAEEQLSVIEEFLRLKGKRLPFTNLRFLGRVDESRYAHLGLLTVRRVLHHPGGSFQYQKRSPTIPEIGICWDFLHHLAIGVDGRVSICARFDPHGLGVIGNVKSDKLADLWNGQKRQDWLRSHLAGKRSLVPLCALCDFWGVPISP